MTLKMLKMKLRKMKGKGQISDPYLADFTQKIIDTRKSNEEIIDMDRQEGEGVTYKRLIFTLCKKSVTMNWCCSVFIIGFYPIFKWHYAFARSGASLRFKSGGGC